MINETKIVAQQAEPAEQHTPSPASALDRLAKGMLMAQGFRLDR